MSDNELQFGNTLFCELKLAVLNVALLQQLGALGIGSCALWRKRLLLLL